MSVHGFDAQVAGTVDRLISVLQFLAVVSAKNVLVIWIFFVGTAIEVNAVEVANGSKNETN